jgi:hypothetical protein
VHGRATCYLGAFARVVAFATPGPFRAFIRIVTLVIVCSKSRIRSWTIARRAAQILDTGATFWPEETRPENPIAEHAGGGLLRRQTATGDRPSKLATLSMYAAASRIAEAGSPKLRCRDRRHSDGDPPHQPALVLVDFSVEAPAPPLNRQALFGTGLGAK